MLDKLIYKPETREKRAFYASDVGKPLLDLYFAFRGVAPTNAPRWFDTLKWGAGKGVELEWVNILKMNKIVPEDYDQKQHGRIEIEREGVRINGYIDAKDMEGHPIEIKSINNANYYDVKRYAEGNPKEGYCGQLAVYCDGLDLDSGRLLVSSIDGLNRFEFVLEKVGERRYKCGNIKIDLDKVYKSWAVLWDCVQKETPPDIFQYLYKYPVDKIDWSTVSKADISKARNDKKVLGDWQVAYSPWKNLIVELQGETLGYTAEEIAHIKKATDGYTSKNKR